MKKYISIILLGLFLVILSGCENNGKEFKEAYEALNGKTNSNNVVYRTVTIDSKNAFVKVDPDEIVKKIENKETFYLYVGDEMCPWCRSVIEKAVEVSNDYDIDKIYYIEIWDENHNEIFRNKYELQNEELVETVEGTKAYKFLVQKFESVLKDYTLKDSEGKTVEVGEKRIFAPNFFYVKNGKVVKMISGYSSMQTESNQELTSEMLQDEEKQFNEFFNIANTCTLEGC